VEGPEARRRRGRALEPGGDARARPAGRRSSLDPPSASEATFAGVDSESRRTWIALGILVAIGVGGWLARRHLGLEWSAESVRDVVNGYGVWGPVAFVALMGVRSALLIPSQILLVAAGLCFGAVAGAIYGGLGIVLSGSLAFAVARYAGREAVLANVPPSLHRVMDASSGRAGATALFLGTAYPVGPITAFHAGAGLTAMSIPVFLGTLGVASVLRAALYSTFGSSLVEGGARDLLLATAVLAAVTLLPLAHPRSRAWLRRQWGGGATAEVPAPEPSPPERPPPEQRS